MDKCTNKHYLISLYKSSTTDLIKVSEKMTNIYHYYYLLDQGIKQHPNIDRYTLISIVRDTNVISKNNFKLTLKNKPIKNEYVYRLSGFI